MKITNYKISIKHTYISTYEKILNNSLPFKVWFNKIRNIVKEEKPQQFLFYCNV